MDHFVKSDISALNGDFFSRVGKDWMLISAGTPSGFNTMTASWGGVGVLWNRNVSFVFIRDSRYTLEFVDQNDCYSLSFFNGGYRKELTYCGKTSGRDVDKIKETGLTPVFGEKAPGFEEAELVVVCKKLYKQSMNAQSFLDRELINTFYADGDWHEVFVGEICEVWVKP